MPKEMLTKRKIQEICKSQEGQACICKFVESMNDQGVTRMFIDFTKVYSLVKRMVEDKLIEDNGVLNVFSEEFQKASLIEYCTEKMIEFLSMVDNVENKPASDGLPMLNELATYYLLMPMQPIKVYFWMSEYAREFKVRLEDIVKVHFFFRSDEVMLWHEYNRLIAEALPIGIDFSLKSIEWIEKKQEEFSRIDFSDILNDIDFDRYYFELFEKGLGAKELKYISEEKVQFTFVSKDEIKRLTEEAFKAFVLDEVFKVTEYRNHENLQEAVNKLYFRRPTFVYHLYSKAIMVVKVSEFKRMEQEFQKIIDEIGRKYEPKNNNSSGPVTYMGNPWWMPS